MHTIYLTLISINKTKKFNKSASAAPPTARVYGALTITQFSSVARAATTKAKQTVSVVVIALTTKAGSDADVHVGTAHSTSRHFHSSFSSRYLSDLTNLKAMRAASRCIALFFSLSLSLSLYPFPLSTALLLLRGLRS